MNMDAKVTVPAQVLARHVGAETVILDLASGTYYGLDSVGARAWHLASQGQTLTQVCETLLTEYDVGREQLQHDIAALFQSLADKKLVILGA